MSVLVVLVMAVAVGAVCCGRWVGGTCVSMVRTASFLRVVDCACNEEDCKSAKRLCFSAQFVQQTTSQYLPYQLHYNNKSPVYKHLTLVLHVSAYIGRHLTGHVCARRFTEQHQQHGYRRYRKCNTCIVRGLEL